MLRALGLGWPTWSTLSRKGSEHGQVDQTIKPAGLSALTHMEGREGSYSCISVMPVKTYSNALGTWLNECVYINAWAMHAINYHCFLSEIITYEFDSDLHTCVGLLMLTKGYQNAVIDYFRIYLKFREWERWFKFALRVKYDVLSVGFFRGKEINMQLIKYT